MLFDWLVFVIFFEMLWLTNVIFGLETTGWQTIGLLWTVANTLYVTLLNILVSNNPKFMGLKVAFLIQTIILTSFVGSFAGKFTEEADGEKTIQIMCYVALPIPAIQLFYGIILIQYRYAVFVLNNDGLSDISAATEVTPFSEYGGKIPLMMLLI